MEDKAQINPWKSEFKFLCPGYEVKAYVNPMHLRQAAAVIMSEQQANFIEVSHTDGTLVMLGSWREDRKDNGGFVFLFPDEDETENEDY
jgi:hypothetical protein